MRNHIFLLWNLTNELRDLIMVQMWIDAAREGHPTNQRIQLALDRRQDELNVRMDEIHNLMFDVSQNN